MLNVDYFFLIQTREVARMSHIIGGISIFKAVRQRRNQIPFKGEQYRSK